MSLATGLAFLQPNRQTPLETLSLTSSNNLSHFASFRDIFDLLRCQRLDQGNVEVGAMFCRMILKIIAYPEPEFKHRIGYFQNSPTTEILWFEPLSSRLTTLGGRIVTVHQLHL